MPGPQDLCTVLAVAYAYFQEVGFLAYDRYRDSEVRSLRKILMLPLP